MLDRKKYYIICSHHDKGMKRHEMFKSKNALIRMMYSSEYDFKDIYQLIHFTERLYAMSHGFSKSVEILRSMIAR